MEGNILLSCRDDICCEQILEQMSETGITPAIVNDELDLLLEVLEQDFQVVIYDFEVLNDIGLKTVKILRRIRPKISVVVLSSEPSKKLGGQLLQEGVVYYAVKPLNFAALNDVLFHKLN